MRLDQAYARGAVLPHREHDPHIVPEVDDPWRVTVAAHQPVEVVAAIVGGIRIHADSLDVTLPDTGAIDWSKGPPGPGDSNQEDRAMTYQITTEQGIHIKNEDSWELVCEALRLHETGEMPDVVTVYTDGQPGEVYNLREIIENW